MLILICFCGWTASNIILSFRGGFASGNNFSLCVIMVPPHNFGKGTFTKKKVHLSKTFIIPQLYILFLEPLNLWGPARVTRSTGQRLNGKRTYSEVVKAMVPESIYGITF